MKDYAGSAFMVFYLTASVHRNAIVVFLRSGFGSRFFEPQGIVTFLSLAFLGTGFKVFWGYFWIWLFVLLGQRLETLRRHCKGVRNHSRFPGHPYMGMFMPGVKDVAGGFQAEPFICLFFGMVLATINLMLGVFVMAGFVSLAACMAIEAFHDGRRIQAMRDAEIEMQNLAGRYRGES